MDREIRMTVAQLFLACLDFLLFICLGVIFIRQQMIFRSLKKTQAMTLETRRMIDAHVTQMLNQGEGLWPQSRSWDQQGSSPKGISINPTKEG
jgi:hypothetical protein